MIYLKGQCDYRGCKHQFKDGEEAYCVDCYVALESELSDAVKELERAQETIGSLQEENGRLRANQR